MRKTVFAALGAVALAVATAAADDGATIRVVQWNIGHFAMGRSSETAITPEDSAAKSAEYRAEVARLNPDFLGVSEFDMMFDKAGRLSTNEVFASFPTKVIGPKNHYQWNALFTHFPVLRHEVVNYKSRAQKTYFLDCVFMMGTNEVHFVQSHLDWKDLRNSPRHFAQLQVRQLIEHFWDKPYVIISADYNINDFSMFAPFEEAGYDIANKGTYAVLDNVVVKGFEVKSLFEGDGKQPRRLSDHRIVGCDLKLSPEHARKQKWRLKWSDEFNGGKLDTNVWERCNTGGSDWNRHMSTRPDLVFLTNGCIVMRGVANDGTDKDKHPWLTGGIQNKAGPVISHMALGKVLIRAKFQDHQKGAWPALWMCGSGKDSQGRGYPWNGGEIDIVERLNGDAFVYHTVHSGWTLHKKHPNEPRHGGKGTIRNGHWNVYGLEITPTELIWSVNGKDTFRYPKTDCGDPDQWPFYMPHYFLLDMQLGGKWVGKVELSTLPVEMQIDYIRIYERGL